MEPDWCIHPGATLLEVMALHFSVSCGIGSEVIEKIVSGEEEITPEIAAGLSRGTGIPEELWLKMESNFRQGLAAGKSWMQ